MWRTLSDDHISYGELCASAFGRVLPYAERPGALAATYRAARKDEPGDMPLLFRVDKELGVPEARRYVADCGGRGQCWRVRGGI